MWNFSLTRAGQATACGIPALHCHVSVMARCHATLAIIAFDPKIPLFPDFSMRKSPPAPSSSGWCSPVVLQPCIDSAQPRALPRSSVSLPAPPSAKIVQLMNFAIDLWFTRLLGATAAALPGPRVPVLLFEARLWERRGVCMISNPGGNK